MDRKRGLSDEEVEQEIERLNRERKGKELMAAGITEDMLDGIYEEE